MLRWLILRGAGNARTAEDTKKTERMVRRDIAAEFCGWYRKLNIRIMVRGLPNGNNQSTVKENREANTIRDEEREWMEMKSEY